MSHLSMRSNTKFAIESEVAAVEKSSTCRSRRTRELLMKQEYRHGAWVVGVSPKSRRIESACFSQRQGASRCPCIANRIGMTCVGSRGSRFMWSDHQERNALYGWM